QARCKERRGPATVPRFHGGDNKSRINPSFFFGEEKGPPRGGKVGSRAKLHVFFGCAAFCAPAMACARAAPPASPARHTRRRAGGEAARRRRAAVPIARIAGMAGGGADPKQPRFLLAPDKPIQHRAFLLADPYRVVIDMSQVSFQLPAGVGAAGRGLIKAFRYGLVMPGGSRIVFDLTGPAKIANSYVLEAANGQPPPLGLEV